MSTKNEIERNRWIERHLGMCGTCIYKECGVCINDKSYLNSERVKVDDMCDLWSEKRE